MRKPKVVILSAGIGSRLGTPYPKGLTPLNNGETIFSRQLRLFREFGLNIIVVVGFKKDLIMEADPHVLYAYNADFDTTNTSKSLLYGLQHIFDEDVLWINGDVVFHYQVIERMLKEPGSLVVVNDAKVGEEEVKYTTNANGFINAISKHIIKPLGEAVGINLIEADHLEAFKGKLRAVEAQDYFERGMELLIQEKGDLFRPLNVGHQACIEVDFKEDLQRARKIVKDKFSDTRT
jgi:choline kinase